MSSDNPTGGDNQQETHKPRSWLDPQWVLGFVDGEGCFCVVVRRNPYVRSTGYWQLQPVFQVSQHERHRAVLEELVVFFDCGRVRSKGPNSTVQSFGVTRLDDLERRIIPFFEHHELVVKSRDFALFAEIVRSLRAKLHLTHDGFERLARLAYAMNANGKQRARPIEAILERGSSETVRQADGCN